MKDKPSNPPKIISNHGSPYMIRWSILTIFGLSFKFHVFLRSDPDCLHDHPWDFWTIVLAGKYNEVVEQNETGLAEDGSNKIIRREAFSIAFRKAEHKHRVELINGEPCLTLCIMKKKRREWGFWSKGAWIHWKNFFTDDKNSSTRHEC